MKECVGLFHRFCRASGLSEYSPSTWNEYRRWVVRSLADYNKSQISNWDEALFDLWSESNDGAVPA